MEAGAEMSRKNTNILLEICKIKSLAEGKHSHAYIIRQEIEPRIFVLNSLIGMYAKCKSTSIARQMFDKMLLKNVFTWTAIITAYIQHGDSKEALNLYKQMRLTNIKSDAFTFSAAIGACIGCSAICIGKSVHADILRSGLDSDVVIGSRLIDMYVKCAHLGEAYQVFERMPVRNVISWTTLIAGYVDYGGSENTLKLFMLMQEGGLLPNEVTFISVLTACADIPALAEGKRVHAMIQKIGLGHDSFVNTATVSMYIKCGSIVEACYVFDRIHNQDVVSWSVILAAYADHGNEKKSMDLFWQMREDGIFPNDVTFLGLLNGCTSTGHGKKVHASILNTMWAADCIITNALIDMYTKCGSIYDACKLFDKSPTQNVVSWNILIAGYVYHGDGMKALETFTQMQETYVRPDDVSFINALVACAIICAFEKGKWLHAALLTKLSVLDVFIGNALIDMYVRCGTMADSQMIFDSMGSRHVSLWNAMIMGHALHGNCQDALYLFQIMKSKSIEPDDITFVSTLNVCTTFLAFGHGKFVHAQILTQKCESNTFIRNRLVDMYAKFGCISDAHCLFHNFRSQDVVSWGALIAGYVQHGEGKEALLLFIQMQENDVRPNEVVFLSVVGACIGISSLEYGKWAHSNILKFANEFDIFLGNSLLDMYTKTADMGSAKQLFNRLPTCNVVTWSALIEGHLQCRNGREALMVFTQMRQEGIVPNAVTFISILGACGGLAALGRGRWVHAEILRAGYGLHHGLLNALVDMYAKCGSLDEARSEFERIRERDIVSWNTLISGYVQHGDCNHALGLFQKLLLENVEPDKLTFLGMLEACAGLSALERGRLIHMNILKTRCTSDSSIGNALTDMYARTGDIKEAYHVFSTLSIQNSISWNVIITAYALYGKGLEAIALFCQMQHEGIVANGLTFIAILSACSKAALMDEGCYYFSSVSECHECPLMMQHYSCIVDLLGRAGYVDEAEEIIYSLPIEPVVDMWRSLLGACNIYATTHIAERTMKHILKLAPLDPAAFVLLLNIYTTVGLQEGRRQKLLNRKST